VFEQPVLESRRGRGRGAFLEQLSCRHHGFVDGLLWRVFLGQRLRDVSEVWVEETKES